jgi:hypothetical protein
MSEVISLFVTFVIAAILYEYMKPKDNHQSTNQKESDDEDD